MNNHHPVLPARPRRPMLAVLACVAVLLAVALPAGAFAATFDPLNVIPYETFRASSSMTRADIQAFLETQTGPLKSLVAKDHDSKTVKKPASQLIYEAAKAWNINPKLIISTLQKEQSLITVSNSSNSARYKKAMGYGVYGDADHDGKTDNRFPGFGNQIYYGAKGLSDYETRYKWVPGMKKTVTRLSDGKSISIVPKNASTFALYMYTPYYPQSLVWNTYVRFFGDPATPPRMRPIYRFRNRSNGTYYYTASEAKRYTLVLKSSKNWSLQGTAYRVDTSATVPVVPLYEMYNTKTHKYSYTSYASTKDRLLKVRPKQWTYNRVVTYVSHSSAGGATPVYRLWNKAKHASYYTSSASTKKSLTSGKKAKFSYKGVSFYLPASAQTTPPVGPTGSAD